MSKTYRSADSRGWKRNLKEESKKLRAHERDYCKRLLQNIDVFEKEDIENLDEVSNPWNWD